MCPLFSQFVPFLAHHWDLRKRNPHFFILPSKTTKKLRFFKSGFGFEIPTLLRNCRNFNSNSHKFYEKSVAFGQAWRWCWVLKSTSREKFEWKKRAKPFFSREFSLDVRVSTKHHDMRSQKAMVFLIWTVFDNSEPVFDNSEPVFDNSEPVFDNSKPKTTLHGRR